MDGALDAAYEAKRRAEEDSMKLDSDSCFVFFKFFNLFFEGLSKDSKAANVVNVNLNAVVIANAPWVVSR